MTIAEKLLELMAELEQLGIDAEDIGMRGASHKIEAAMGDLRSAHAAAEQWREFE